MAWIQQPVDESGQVFAWVNTDTGERLAPGQNPPGDQGGPSSWRDKMGQYPQGTLALEHFGGGAGNGVAVVDANTGQALTRIGDPGWDNFQALYSAGYTKFAKDDGSIGTFEDFGRAVGAAAQAIQTQNREGSTGIGGANTLRNIVAGTLGAALPAALPAASAALGISPKILGPAASAGTAALTGGNPLTAGLASAAIGLLPSGAPVAPTPEATPPALYAAAPSTMTDAPIAWDTVANPAKPGAFPWDYAADPLTATGPGPAPSLSVPGYGDIYGEMSPAFLAALGLGGAAALGGANAGGSIGGGDYGGEATGGYNPPSAASGNALSQALQAAGLSKTVADLIASPIGGALAGGLLSGLGGTSRQAGTTTSIQDVPERLQGYQTAGLEAARGALNAAPTGVSPLTMAGQDYLAATIGGNYLANPYEEAAARAVAQDANNAVTSRFSTAGRYGSPGMAEAIARGVATGTAPIRYNTYNAERARQQAAALAAPDYATALMGQPFSAVNQYANIFGRLAGTSRATTEPYFQQGIGTRLLGGALQGAAAMRLLG